MKLRLTILSLVIGLCVLSSSVTSTMISSKSPIADVIKRTTNGHIFQRVFADSSAGGSGGNGGGGAQPNPPNQDDGSAGGSGGNGGSGLNLANQIRVMEE